jgi:hypothetical protein
MPLMQSGRRSCIALANRVLSLELAVSSGQKAQSPFVPEFTMIHSRSDRYVSFLDIDFEGNMAVVLEHMRRYIDNPATTNAFWEKFKQRMAAIDAGSGSITDKLLLLHSHVYYMVELFEDHDDEQALKDLKKLEEECF